MQLKVKHVGEGWSTASCPLVLLRLRVLIESCGLSFNAETAISAGSYLYRPRV